MQALSPQSSNDLVRVLVNAAPGGFSLNPQVLRELWQRAPHYFDEPLPASEFATAGGGESLEQRFPNLLQEGDEVRFLNSRLPELRTDAWLVQRFDEMGARGLCGRYCGLLKTLDIPADAKWHVVEFEDGTEAIHEDHRIWS